MSHPELSEQLKEFTDRLVGAPHFDKTGSWIRGKMARPSLDTFGNWLGGRLTEFVAGDDDSPTSNGDTTPHENRTFAGPFSHYSTISSSTSSKAPSPQPTVVNHNVLVGAQRKPPLRTGSAQAVRLNSQIQIDRASSAMEYRPIYRSSSPGPRIVSANAATTHFSQASLNYSGYPRANPTNGAYQHLDNETSDVGFRAASWWGSSSPEDSSTTTPTVAMFPNDGSSPPSGFVSLMDVPSSPAVPTSNVPMRSSTLATHDEDDDDDLGLENSSRRRKASLNDSGVSDTPAPDPKAAQTRSQPGNIFMLSLNPCAHLVVEESKYSQQSSSWFSRWWNREGSKGPIKATLGEESSFVYDKELKRWVNKKVSFDRRYPSFPFSIISLGWCRGGATRGDSATPSSPNRISRPLCPEDTKRNLSGTSTRARSFGYRYYCVSSKAHGLPYPIKFSADRRRGGHERRASSHSSRYGFASTGYFRFTDTSTQSTTVASSEAQPP
jgi:COPII coat assembly protein SEC16